MISREVQINWMLHREQGGTNPHFLRRDLASKRATMVTAAAQQRYNGTTTAPALQTLAFVWDTVLL